MKRVGVLALQGDFESHQRALEVAGAEAWQVRTASDLEAIDGLVIPGGESTTMLKLLRAENLFDTIRDFGLRKPIFGTCAGAILLAREVCNPQQESFGLMNIAVERNAYGRQIDSHITHLLPGPEFTDRTEPGNLECVFIRAPIIRHIYDGVRVLLAGEEGPVLVEEGMHLAATFHPELTRDSRVHKLFLAKL